MSRRRRGRITVQSQPTGAARGMMKLMGVVQTVFGFTFTAIAVTTIMPMMPLFSLPFLAAGVFAMVNGIRMIVSKNDIAHRVGYDMETDVQGETIAGLLEDVDAMVKAEREDPSPAQAPITDARLRLEQLEELRTAGLISQREFDEKRRDIIDRL